MKIKSLYIYLPIIGLAASCANPEEKEPVAKVQKQETMMQPFRFHKAIEVSPGLTFDVLSWGRGAKSAGELLILKSDSTEIKYSTLSEELEGTIVDVFNTDMDLDGNPEILIQTNTADSIPLAKVYCYEFGSNNSQKIKFPELTSATQKKYRGKDNFFVKEGKLRRTFPLFEQENNKDLPSKEQKNIEYSIVNGSIDIKEIKEE